MKLIPRDYQIEAYNKLGNSVRAGTKRIVLKAPTGTGKTAIAALIAGRALDKGNRVAFVAPYTTLIDQTVTRFMEYGLPEPGVMQGSHELTDPDKPVQICTAQTLARRRRPEADVIIVDECHLQYKCILDWMSDEPNTVFIGLSATPFAAGMGKHWQNLIAVRTLRNCMEDGTLSQYDVYGVEEPDLSGIGIQNGDYKERELGDFMGDTTLVANIVQNWLEHGKDMQTICFAVNVLHANKVANDFESAGVKVAVIIAETPMEARKEIFRKYEDREIRILISVGCLIAGFDSYVDCIIWGAPTKSEIKFIQGIGRGLRVSPGKDKCVIFDHSGTFTSMGYIEDVDEMFDGLCDGDRGKRSEVKREREEKKEKSPKACPSCTYLKPVGVHQCPKCGFTPRVGEDVEVDESRKLKKLGKKNTEYTKQEKQKFYSELYGYWKQKVFNGSSIKEGWIAHKYKEKFGVWPKGLNTLPIQPSPETINWIKSRNIKWAKSKKRYANG